MAVAYHVIFSSYGFGLPRNRSVSWSTVVDLWEKHRYDECQLANEQRPQLTNCVGTTPQELDEVVPALPPVQFSGEQLLAIGSGFAEAVKRNGYRVRSCAILSEHVHMVIDRHRYRAEQIVGLLKGEATRALSRDGVHPWPNLRSPPSPWAEGCWRAFLSDLESVSRAVEYVDLIPTKEGKPRQRWPFVALDG